MSESWGDGLALGQTSPSPSSKRALWQAELRSLAALALPVVIQTSAQQGMTVIDQVFLGHLGTAELGAAALANSYTNLMWFFLLGFATALDTLGSHAYGAGDRRALVTWCITAAVLLSLLVGPMAVGMALGEVVGRVLFGQDAHTSRLMGRFCDGLILGMWPLMWGTVLTKYLQVQNIMLLPSLIAVVTFLLNIAFNAALVRTIGFRGAPLATSLSRWAQFLMLVLAVWRNERPRQQSKRRPSSEDGEALSNCEGLALHQLQPQLSPLTLAEAVDRSSHGRVAGQSNRGSNADTSKRGSVVADPGTQPHSKSFEELLLLGEIMTTGEEESRIAAFSSRAGSAADGGLHGNSNGGVTGGGSRSSSSGAVGNAAVVDHSEQVGRRAINATAQAGQSFWRTLCQECRMAINPRVVMRFCRLGIPGGLSMAFEAGCFDFSTVLAGRLGAVATAAHAAMLSIVTFTYLACPFALATAGAIRVGNLLGAGDPDGARRAGILAVALSGIFMALMAIILLASRSVLGYMFSSDSQVVKVIRNLAAFAALFQVSDGLMGASQGVLRGCGHQHMTAVFNFTGFWVCGVLMGYLLCFKAGLGLNGLWAGISSGDTATGIMNLVAMSRIRWRREADKAVARLKALAQQAEEELVMLGPSGRDSGGDGGLVGGGILTALGGGGRIYAGGLKRMWSERRLRQAVKDARQRNEVGNIERQNSVALQIIRSLSLMFRRHQTQGDDMTGEMRTGAEKEPGSCASADAQREAGGDLQHVSKALHQMELMT
ncbi:hypothetical protein Vretimale_9243 [Volvox reticuliferus]|uniref:Protein DETOXIFICATION n=1 Tax=Volvox reticuliferus TaxID=1737510 RepID=A0A8J4FPW3_9CHLO|nr:hypothetical protein Vretifemale_10177 [Volvox reticuliferus]GIM04754.1 hypothetical protein Vretimale_9243 [Volvox reticuliferus]